MAVDPSATPVTGIVVVEAPSGTITDEGTDAIFGASELNVIVKPPAGAGAETNNDASRVLARSTSKGDGPSVTVWIVGGRTVTISDAPPATLEVARIVVDPSATPVTKIVVLNWPGGIEADAGTVATAGLSELSETGSPPEGATADAVSVTA